GIYAEMRAGRTSPNGGVYIEMAHLGPDNVRRQFKGMVERCADCGFDLAAGRVEVVPTAHYMMGGVLFAPDCRTAMAGLFAAGEDTGGVHGANRLGGNGVANSTVFGGIAGDTMGCWAPGQDWAEPDQRAVQAAMARTLAPLARRGGDLHALREQLSNVMWDDAGIVRDAEGLQRALAALAQLRGELDSVGVAESGRAYNMTWHDWLNLDSLVHVSEAIVRAALAREDSRGAHFRADYPDVRDLEYSWFSVVSQQDGAMQVERHPVQFTRVRPGQTLLQQDAA